MKLATAALLLAVTACAAPGYKPGLRGAAVVSHGVLHDEERVTAADGTRLFAQAWVPEREPRAVLVIVHGLKDHSSRYGAAAATLVDAGFAVHAFDLRGHGDSEGDRVWVSSFDDYLSDLDVILKRVRKQHPGKPVFLFGHSMGGAIATLYVITRKPELAGLVLSAPALQVGDDVSGVKIFFAKVFGVVAPTLKLLSLDDSKFSRDPKIVESMKKDPLIYDGTGPARTAAQLLGAISRIQEKMEDIEVPLLAMHGTRDEVTNPAGSAALVKRARSKDKTLKKYEGYFHDLLHEPESARLISELREWLTSRAL